MKNLFLFPTDKPSKLYFHNLNNRFGFSTPEPMAFFGSGSWAEGRNIYIISDEEIKVGDSIIDLDIKKTLKADKFRVITSKQSQCWYYKKIILTTDQDLINDGVQSIDDEFLEWFVKNPSCEFVQTDKILQTRHGVNWYDLPNQKKGNEVDGIYRFYYKIIIPKEEPKQETQGYICPKTKILCDDECCVSAEDCHIEAGIDVISEPKQETLEEVAKNATKMYVNEREKQTVYLSFIEGAKWQQQQMYSQEEVELITNEMVNWAIDNIGNQNPQSGKKFDEVIAKYKKK